MILVPDLQMRVSYSINETEFKCRSTATLCDYFSLMTVTDCFSVSGCIGPGNPESIPVSLYPPVVGVAWEGSGQGQI
jgi:hypothetical protein